MKETNENLFTSAFYYQSSKAGNCASQNFNHWLILGKSFL